ncbi:MAG TPA: GNAT family N-acetyltransferase [Ignavibacteria bacterium]|nr:GNAT family N-acetyltransferase [Ignavibacteria bacterium]HMR39589.1 GNAT family N-acetyltransferase [Ignavibacteria bacterium]
MIIYTDDLVEIKPIELSEFFNGWKNNPTPEKLFTILKNSSYKVLAIDDESDKVIGFINAISDKALSAYIPLLEVIPEYQGKGIGSELVKRMLKKLEDYYMIDVVCDESVQKFYEKFGLKKHSAMILRNYDKQSGKD